MKRRIAALTVLFAWMAMLGLSACGKKAAPALPGKELPFRIEELSATLEDGWVVLKGRLVKPAGKNAEISEAEITGWRVYHAHYPIENGPCEGCPLDFSRVYEKDGKVGEDGRFSTRVALEPPVDGIHFFQVRLTGRGWAVGSLSNQAKLVIH
jgi:hypothetical protein